VLNLLEITDHSYLNSELGWVVLSHGEEVKVDTIFL
jgi:hypothetical protein